MKVALLLYPITKEGGLTTKTLTFYNEMTARGYEVDFYRISYGRKHNIGEDKPTVRVLKGGIVLQHKWLSIADQFLKETLEILNGYDRIVFLHPCPHICDLDKKAVPNWPHLYTDTTPPKTVTFSDVFWDKYYPHLKQVVGTFQALAVNSAVKRKTIEICPDVRLVHQIYKDPGPEVRAGTNRDIDVIWASAWRSWKGIAQFLRSLALTDLSAELYGWGREAWTLEPERNKLRSQQKVVRQVHPDRVLEGYARCRTAADFTGRSKKYFGHYNRTTIEPILYGAPPLVVDTLVDPHSIIPSEICLVIPSKQKPMDTAQYMLELLEDDEKIRATAARGYEWFRENHNSDQALNTLLMLDG